MNEVQLGDVVYIKSLNNRPAKVVISQIRDDGISYTMDHDGDDYYFVPKSTLHMGTFFFQTVKEYNDHYQKHNDQGLCSK